MSESTRHGEEILTGEIQDGCLHMAPGGPQQSVDEVSRGAVCEGVCTTVTSIPCIGFADCVPDPLIRTGSQDTYGSSTGNIEDLSATLNEIIMTCSAFFFDGEFLKAARKLVWISPNRLPR